LVGVVGTKLEQLDHFIFDLIDSHITGGQKEARRKVYAFDVGKHALVLNGVPVSLMRDDFSEPPKIHHRGFSDVIEYGNRELEIEIYPYHSSVKKTVKDGDVLDEHRYPTLEITVHKRKKNRSGMLSTQDRYYAIEQTPEALQALLKDISPTFSSEYAVPDQSPSLPEQVEIPASFAEETTDSGLAPVLTIEQGHSLPDPVIRTITPDELRERERKEDSQEFLNALQTPLSRFGRLLQRFKKPLIGLGVASILGMPARENPADQHEQYSFIQKTREQERADAHALHLAQRRSEEVKASLDAGLNKQTHLLREFLARDKSLKQHDRTGKLKYDTQKISLFMEECLEDLRRGSMLRFSSVRKLSPEHFKEIAHELESGTAQAEKKFEDEVLKPLLKVARHTLRNKH
jgi:hypothetical protein